MTRDQKLIRGFLLSTLITVGILIVSHFVFDGSLFDSAPSQTMSDERRKFAEIAPSLNSLQVWCYDDLRASEGASELYVGIHMEIIHIGPDLIRARQHYKDEIQRLHLTARVDSPEVAKTMFRLSPLPQLDQYDESYLVIWERVEIGLDGKITGTEY